MLAVYIGQSKLDSLRSLLDQDPELPGYDPSDQLMLLSSQMLEHVANGRLSLEADPFGSTNNSVSLWLELVKHF